MALRETKQKGNRKEMKKIKEELKLQLVAWSSGVVVSLIAIALLELERMIR